jgi:hypothetical protein
VLALDADGSNLDFFFKKLVKHQTEIAEYQMLINRDRCVA